MTSSACSVFAIFDARRRAQNVSFIPGYPAARAFTEMRNSPVQILHLVHSRPVPWHDLLAPIADELNVPLVPYTAWLTALDKSAGASEGTASNLDAMRDNPALRLLEFFRSRRDSPKDREPLGTARLATGKARSVSETLANMHELGGTDARRWVTAWRASGFLPSAGLD